MNYWPWWLGAIALAAVPLVHRVLLDRSFAVSGRFTALVDRIRFGAPEPAPALGEGAAAMLAALRAQTEEAFGASEIEAPAELTAQDERSIARLTSPQSSATHVLFFVGLALGGLISALLAGGVALRTGLAGDAFNRLVAQLHVPAPIVLLFGGVLVGVGTRMAAGCTS